MALLKAAQLVTGEGYNNNNLALGPLFRLKSPERRSGRTGTCASPHCNFPLYPGIISDDDTCGEVLAARGVREEKKDGEAPKPLAFTLDW